MQEMEAEEVAREAEEESDEDEEMMEMSVEALKVPSIWVLNLGFC